MIIKFIYVVPVDTFVFELPEPDMVVDPRHDNSTDLKRYEVNVNGTAMTVTKIRRNANENPGMGHLRFRVYSRNEFHYPFDSTKYLYHGYYGERAPRNATEIIVKDGTERIRNQCFWGCSSLSKITIPNTVTRIEEYAFSECRSLRYIQLPSNLQLIERFAFKNCSSLETIHIPPAVTEICQGAFENCKSLRIMNVPDSVQIISYYIVVGCDDLLMDEERNGQDDIQTWIRNRYNPLHNLCWDPSVNATNIQQYIQQHHNNDERARTNDKPQFTPLHILAANPSAAGDMITTYLQLAPDVAVMQDNKGKTPLHMLCSVPSFLDGTGGAIVAYLGGCSEGKKAAFMTDNEGRTPFDCFCEKNVEGLLFLENTNFGGLMAWWYDCLGINLFA